MIAPEPSLEPELVVALWNQVCGGYDPLEKVLVKFAAMIVHSAWQQMTSANGPTRSRAKARRGQNRRRRIDLALARSLLEAGRELREVAALMNVGEKTLARALATGEAKPIVEVSNDRAKARAA